MFILLQSTFVLYNVDMWSQFLSLLFPPTEHENVVEKSTSLVANTSIKLSPKGHSILTCSSYTNEAVHAAILLQKKHNQQRSTILLANLLSDVLLEDLSERLVWSKKDIYITTIPLSPRRRRTSGVNHLSHILMCTATPLRTLVVQNILIQPKDIPMQKTLSRKERLLNVSGAFCVQHPEQVRGKHIIVMDDITTTGATLDEAVRALKTAGATVTLVALARA